jgi:hypothetical protein
VLLDIDFSYNTYLQDTFDLREYFVIEIEISRIFLRLYFYVQDEIEVVFVMKISDLDKSEILFQLFKINNSQPFSAACSASLYFPNMK